MTAFRTSLLSAALLGLLLPPSAFAATTGDPAASRCSGTPAAGLTAPTPADPYPLMAAGWGPELGGGLMASRWAEDWSGLRAAGRAPALKALPLGGSASLTLGAELRLRHADWDDARLVPGNDFAQEQLRAVFGADLRLAPHLRVYGELGTGRVAGRRDAARANLQNVLALQQLFVDVHGHLGDALVGAMVGRQEFADGPRQLVSLGDGANLHRTWNGVRAYLHAPRYRVGAFDLRATRPGRGGFDEASDGGETLRGLTSSVIVSRGDGPNTYLDPFWLHSDVAAAPADAPLLAGTRDSIGVRLWGRVGDARFDWTAVRQTGRTGGRPVAAWGLFAVQSLALSDAGWTPRLTSRLDIASGGDATDGTSRSFDPLYASSSYLGESQFLGLTNLLAFAPGLSLSPTPRTTLSFEYAFARRLRTADAVYAGGMRPYAGTAGAPGAAIGGLARVSGTWSVTPRLELGLTLEHLAAGGVLRRAGFSPGRYAALSATYRY